MEIKIGTKIKAFEFEDTYGMAFEDEMRGYIGRIGIVIEVYEPDNQVKLAFYDEDKIPYFASDKDIELNYNLPETFDDYWFYLLDKAHEYIVYDNNELFPIY